MIKHSLMEMKSSASRLIFLRSDLLRRLCTTASAPMEAAETAAPSVAGGPVTPKTTTPAEKRLIRRLSAIGASGGKVKVADVLHLYIREGNVVRKGELLNCLKVLRKYRRYHHCFEILEWMEKGRINYSARDYALRLDIISKLKGLAEAEKYFDSLSPDAKNLYTYGALLNCYCKENMADKAVALFEEMEKLNFCSPLSYNNLIVLFLKVGQPERVPPLIQVMKERNLALSSHSYNFLMQSYAAMNDLEGVERVAEELQKDNKKCDWTLYSNLAHIYIKFGLFGKAESALGQMEEILEKSDYCDRLSYHFLISLYSKVGNKVAVARVWDSLKSRFPICHNISYLCLLQALHKLDDIGGLTKYYEEWKASYKHHDPRLANVVIGAYLKHNMATEAELLLKDSSMSAGPQYFKQNSMFITYFLDKGDIHAALRHMEAAIVKVNIDQKWLPEPEQIDAFFKYFEEQKDVDGAEHFCTMLKKVSCLNSKVYLSLLQIYAAAGKTATGLRKRMEEYGVEISSEHENLLEKVCPK
ncbi:hypothetical protein Ancab_020352 [Ancistrocladus abbreviatus]